MASQRNIYQTLSERGIDEFAFKTLLEHGRRSGHLNRDEVVDVIPDTEFDDPLIDEFVQAITQEGIEVEEDEPDYDPYPEEGDAVAITDLSAMEAEARDINLAGIEVDDTLSVYMREATSIPLLTAEEEVVLAKRIERCRKAYEEMARGGVQPERQRDLDRIIDDGRMAREHLIRANSRLVISVAKKYMGRGMPLTDLIQEGNIGLMRAIRNFDYKRGFKFSTYATWWIRQAISRAMADQSRTIRLPAYLSDQVGRLRRTQLELQQRLGRKPTNAELGAAMKLPEQRVEQMLESIAQPMSLEAPVGKEDETELGDLLEDANAIDPEQAVGDRMENDQMLEKLAELPFRERRVIELRFGLGDQEPLTLAEVGQELGITRERARQLEMQALERMRNPEAIHRKRRGPQR